MAAGASEAACLAEVVRPELPWWTLSGGGRKGTRGHENRIWRRKCAGSEDVPLASQPAGAPSGRQAPGSTGRAGTASKRCWVARKQPGKRMRRSQITRSAFKNVGTIQLSQEGRWLSAQIQEGGSITLELVCTRGGKETCIFPAPHGLFQTSRLLNFPKYFKFSIFSSSEDLGAVAAYL